MMIKKWKQSLAILLALSLILTYGLPWIFAGQIGLSTARLSLAFDGIGKGLDPKGDRFDINEIKNQAVLKAALQAAGLEEQMTVEELRKNIAISPVTNTDALKQLTAMTSISGKTEDMTQKIVYPNEYIIKIKGAKPALLDEVMAAYKDYLRTKYIANINAETLFTKEGLQALDYPEMVTVLTQEADSLVRYAGGFAKSHPEFISPEKAISFTDLYEQARMVRTVDVANLEGISDYYALTKDVTNRVKYEETILKRATLVLQKAEGQQYRISEIISLYDNYSNFIFAVGDTPQLDTQAKETFYGDLMEELVDSKNSTIDAAHKVSEIYRALGKLQGTLLTPEQYEVRAQELSDGVSIAFQRIETIRELIQTIAAEHYDLEVDSKIAVGSSGYQFYSWGNPLLNFIILAAIWFLGIFLWSQGKKYIFPRTSRRRSAPVKSE